VPIEQWVAEVVQGNDRGRQFKENPTVDPDGSFRRISSIGIFEIKGSENSEM
jgi:hypothetical protein